MRIKKDDTYPLTYRILNDDNTPMDLSGAASGSVNFQMKLDSVGTVVGGTAEIVTAASGDVKYSWQAGETSTIGMYRAEFIITFNDGTIKRVPTKEALWVWIMDNTEETDGT
jgi:hypothetical protein